MSSGDADSAALLADLGRTIPPMNVADGEKLLREVQDVLDSHGVVFFLRQGTCLGAVRDGALIPWDDDLDIGSIVDMHGFTESLIEPVAESLRSIGCYVEVRHDALYTAVKIMKYRIKVDWHCHRVVKGTIAHYPGVPFPVGLFEQLRDVPFLGRSFRVPDPPEEYLRYKYGPDWQTPKRVGYEKDVLDNMPAGPVPGRPGTLRPFLAKHIYPRKPAKLLVLDEIDAPVEGAKVVIAGLNESHTNRKGVASFYLPRPADYAVAVTANGLEEVLYEESLAPGKMCVYRPDPERPAGRYFVLTEALTDAGFFHDAEYMSQRQNSLPPLDIERAGRMLREAKEVFDEMGVVFFLRQGTCLGAVRDGALIPWDDDLDIGSIVGMHGFSEGKIRPTVSALKVKGFYVKVLHYELYTAVKLFKYNTRMDWQCYRVVAGTIAHYPGVPFPVSLFERLQEASIDGTAYLVPSPAQGYLQYKYGPDWKTPKEVGYEKDVLDAMPEGSVPGRASRLRQGLAVAFSTKSTARLLVMDEHEQPARRATVSVAGLGTSKTNRNGVATFYLPGAENYALRITAGGREEVLYEEALIPGRSYVYRPDPEKREGRYFVLTEE